MEAQHIQIRDQQKEIWNRFSQGWKKWDDLTMDFLKPYGDEIIHLINPKGVDMVLDIASGTGEPGLTIASKLRGGMVVISDLADDMLSIAREKATKRGIKNLEIVSADVSSLPFSDNSFDAVSCRFGFMFFPDLLLAAKEITRVLKPGGKIATAVWSVPEKNYWANAILNTINKDLHLPLTPNDEPGLFRCSGRGMISGLFKKAGLKNISEIEISGKLNAGTTETYWNFMTECTVPVVAALSNTSDSLKRKIKDEVFEAINNKYPHGRVSIEGNALIIYGEK